MMLEYALKSLVLSTAASLLAAGPSWSEPQVITIDLPKGASMEMVRVEAGTFLMGTPLETVLEWRRFNEEQIKLHPTSHKEKLHNNWETPQHRVTLTRPFYLGKTEVKEEQWLAVTDSVGDLHLKDGSVHRISWVEVQEYIARLNEQTGLLFRLPTEAEWEIAARAGTSSLWWTGDDAREARGAIGNTSWPNPWGFVKILGGVAEYMADGRRVYAKEPEVDPRGPDPYQTRRAAIRGGDDGEWGSGWATGWNPFPWYARSAYRSDESIGRKDWFVGFRLLLEETSPTHIQGERSWGEIKRGELDRRARIDPST